MDCFDTHYYQLNRKLLLLVGQWPFQRHTVRVKIWILYLFVVAIAYSTMVAKAITTDMDFYLYIEYLSDGLTGALAFVRYFLFTFKNDKATELLENMKLNWQSLMDDDEYQIFARNAEDGRLYALHYLRIAYSAFIVWWTAMFLSPLLNYINLFNYSNPRILLYPAEYFIDEEKYYYVILVHMNITVFIEVTAALAADTFFMVFMYHAAGIFKIACHRLEHAFDDCHGRVKHESDRTNVCERIATAVEYHRRATRFCHTLSAMFAWANLISILLVLVNITVTLYWGIVSTEKGFKTMAGVMLGIGQMIHILTLEIPAQMITDDSESVTHKAYSSAWYMAPAKQQRLVLLAMQRGLRPSALMMGKFYPVSLQNYATEVKASFSYLTVLMSLK